MLLINDKFGLKETIQAIAYSTLVIGLKIRQIIDIHFLTAPPLIVNTLNFMSFFIKFLLHKQ